MWGARKLSSLAGILSGSVALLGSSDSRISRTSVGEREISLIVLRVLSMESRQVGSCRLVTQSELVHGGLNTE